MPKRQNKHPRLDPLVIAIDQDLISMNATRLQNAVRAEQGLPPTSHPYKHPPFRWLAFRRLILTHGLTCDTRVIGAARDRIIMLHAWYRMTCFQQARAGRDAARRLERLSDLWSDDRRLFDRAVVLSSLYTA